MVDMTLSAEEIFRTKSLKIIKKYDLLFPHFPFAVFEYQLKQAIENHTVYNRLTVKTFVKNQFKLFNENKCKENIYGYDYEKELMIAYDGLIPIPIDKALETYGQAYFMYITSCALAISNFAIRFDNKKDDLGFFPKWEYEYFKIILFKNTRL